MLHYIATLLYDICYKVLVGNFGRWNHIFYSLYWPAAEQARGRERGPPQPAAPVPHTIHYLPARQQPEEEDHTAHTLYVLVEHTQETQS